MHQAQQLAAEAVSQVFAGRNLTVVLDSLASPKARLTPQQRGQMQDLAYSVLRHYGRLQAILNQLLQKPLQDAQVRSLLLVALYQLEDGRIAPHTVVDQAVRAVAHGGKGWAKALVNAILRNYLRRQQALVDGISPHDELARYSYPQWWVNKIRQQYPDQWEAILATGNQHPPMTLRVNQKKSSVEAYAEKLKQTSISAHVLGGAAIMLEQPLPVDKLPGFAQGETSVQDYGAQYAAHALDVADGMRVLDACCAPGGKTSHILELADAEMLALDSDAGRLKRVEDNLQRLQLKAQVIAGDAAQPDMWWDGQVFDRILADVPCTASGIVRRHVDIKWLRRETDIASFAQQQARILPQLWQLLAKGGKLLYATCSVFREENQQQIDDFLSKHEDARQLPLSFEGMHAQHGQLYPCADHDGFFYALLQKQ